MFRQIRCISPAIFETPLDLLSFALVVGIVYGKWWQQHHGAHNIMGQQHQGAHNIMGHTTSWGIHHHGAHNIMGQQHQGAHNIMGHTTSWGSVSSPIEETVVIKTNYHVESCGQPSVDRNRVLSSNEWLSCLNESLTI